MIVLRQRLAVVVFVLIVAAAGCSGTSSDAMPTTTDASDRSDAESAASFADDVDTGDSSSSPTASGIDSSGGADAETASLDRVTYITKKVPPDLFIAISVSESHSCGLRADGTVACWGDNYYGQTDAPEGQFTHVALGPQHSCGLRVDRKLRCWGDTDRGLSGSPSGHFATVAVSGAGSCAIRISGAIFCWGGEEFNRFLYRDLLGPVENPPRPPLGKFTALAVGGTHSCALGVAGDIACWSRWGRDISGDVIMFFDTNTQGQADAPSGRYISVVAGRAHSCALNTVRTVTCWGDNHQGQAAPPRGEFNAIAANSDNSCGLLSDNRIACWGAIAGFDPPDGPHVTISVGDRHACALRVDHSVACWGVNSSGQTNAPGGRFAAVSVAGDRSCGLRADGTTIDCWGYDLRRPKQPDLRPPPPGLACGEIYTIEVSDTLFSISERFDVSIDDLIEVNNITNPDVAFVGDTLCIPPQQPDPPTPTTHFRDEVRVLVANGTTVCGAAGRLATSLSAQGYNVLPAVNADNAAEISSVYYVNQYGADAAEVASLIQVASSQVLPLPASPPTAPGEAHVVVHIGADDLAQPNC